MRFENTFWSSDYISGIKALLNTLEEGCEDGRDSLEYYKSYADLLDLQSTKLREISTKSHRFLERHTNMDHKGPSRILENFEQTHHSLSSLEHQKRVGLKNVDTIRETKTALSLKIQSDITLRLSDFIEDYSDFISDSRKSLSTQFNVYTKSNQQVLTCEKYFFNKSRELEDVDIKEHNNAPTEIRKDEVAPQASETPTKELDDEVFQFPLQIGSTVFQDINELKNFMSLLINEIPVKRRLIPIPGMNNEYFSSENFFTWVKSNFENEDSRRKIEKFGQDLINLGLLSNWNKLTANKFASDEGYYEFTDLARYISKFDENKIPKVEVTPSAQESKAPATSVFDGLRNKFRSTDDIVILKQNLKEAKQKYLEAVDKSYGERKTLESLIQSVSRKAEIFETNRVKIITESNNLFSEIVVDEHKSELAAAKDVSDEMIVNDDTLKFELLQRSINNNAGWYWPRSEARFSNYGRSKTTSNVELFGHDLLNQYRDPNDTDPVTKSVPLFLKKMIQYLDSTENNEESWSNEIDIAKVTEIKRFILRAIPDFEEQFNPEDSDIDIDHHVTTKAVSELVSKYSTNAIVGVLKLWLLELPDSIIPFTAFDQLRTCYLEGEDDSSKIKVLGSIPRQNLASLLFISQYLSKNVSNVNQLINNERVPLHHLLVRPSPKLTNVNVEDIIIFKSFCHDLLKNEFQNLLSAKLAELEEIHLQREKRAEESLQRLKQQPKELSPPPKLTNSGSVNNSLTVDGLRPFKTKSPLTSPMSSPKVGRSRTNSNLFSPLRRPSDSLHKRTLSKNVEKELPTIKKDENVEADNNDDDDVVEIAVEKNDKDTKIDKAVDSGSEN